MCLVFSCWFLYRVLYASPTILKTSLCVSCVFSKDFPGMRIGPEPTTDRFVSIFHGTGIRDKTRHDETKTRQDKTRHGKARQGKTRQRQDKARQETRQDKTRQDKARQDNTRQDNTRQHKTTQDNTRQNTTCVRVRARVRPRP